LFWPETLLNMAIYKYFTDERFADAFMRDGEMKFGSLVHYRGLEDGGRRGDAKDGTLHYAPPEGLEITMVKDGRKLTGVSFTTAAQNMFVFCLSNELSAERAKDFGRFCVEIADADALVTRVKARASRTSKLDYERTIYGPIEYRPLDKIPGVDWAFPERIVLMKPPEYACQAESRIAVPLKADATSNDDSIIMRVGKIAHITRLHRF
jgi:hypothetical protein